MQTGLSWQGETPADLGESFEQLPSALESELAEAANDIRFRIERKATENAPVGATGNLQTSIGSFVETVGPTLVRIRVGSSANYATPVEEGTDPHFPPPSELRAWARSTLGDESAAYPVARSIAANGTDAQPFLEPAFEDTLDYAMTRINDAVTDAFAEVGLK